MKGYYDHEEIAQLLVRASEMEADLEFKHQLLGRYEAEADERNAENERLRERVEHRQGCVMKARIDAALALHVKLIFAGYDFCKVCMTKDEDLYSWPCPTVKALRGEE